MDLRGRGRSARAAAPVRARWADLDVLRGDPRGAAQGLFYTVPPVTIPEADRRAMTELITRANFGIPIGNFELDLNDGELRCKTSIDVTGDRLSHPLLHQLVLTNLKVMRIYLPAVRAVLAGAAPIDAIA